MTKEDVFWSLEAWVGQLAPEKRSQAAGALRTLRRLLGVTGEGGQR